MSSQIDKGKNYAVFIPCYNAATTIKETIESVHKAILYTSLSIPVFIYDDCSKDSSYTTCSEIIKGYSNFSVVKNSENLGERTTTNRAFKQFQGNYDWAFIIHADDIVKEDWLAAIITEIEKVDNGSCITVWSSYDTLLDKSNKVEPGDNSNDIQLTKKDVSHIKEMLTKVTSSWHISGSAINVNLYQKLNGFDEGMPQFGDTDFIVKALLAGYSYVYIARTLMYYRISNTSVTSISYMTNRDIREIYLLLDKYKNLLDKSDKKKMIRLVINWTGRRMVKWILKKKVGLAILNFKQFNQAVGKYLRTT